MSLTDHVTEAVQIHPLDQAYKDGFAAGVAGFFEETCPHPGESDQGDMWLQGHCYGTLSREHKIENDLLEQGAQAAREGLSESALPQELDEKAQRLWRGGYRAERFLSTQPKWNVDEDLRVSSVTDADYLANRKTGIPAVNPYPEYTPHHDVWATRMLDLPVIYGDEEDDFEIIGTPIPMTIVAEHDDGSVTYSIPAPGHRQEQ